VIRRATPADIEALGRLGALLMRQHHGFDPERFMAPGRDPEAGYGWFLGTQLEEPDAALFVAEQEGRVVGYVYATVEPRSWQELREESGFIHDLFVDDQARGGGTGTRLLDAALDWLKERGQPQVVLWSAAQNAAAQRLFERRGFRRTMVEMTRGL
jgi:ribosomal protein S18 acetylase RimI-like enzyme